MKIVAAPNAFKGSLTANEVAQAMQAGIQRALPEAEIVRVPVADGGDGLVEVANEALGGELRTYTVTGPLGDAVWAALSYVPAPRTSPPSRWCWPVGSCWFPRSGAIRPRPRPREPGS